MERYRTGLILTSAEFDTYRSIYKYAVQPLDTAAFMSFEYLLKRTETKIRWDVTRLDLKSEHVGFGIGLRTGAKIKDAESGEAPDLDKMSQEELEDLYKEACKAAGMDVDPASFSVDAQLEQ